MIFTDYDIVSSSSQGAVFSIGLNTGCDKESMENQLIGLLLVLIQKLIRKQFIIF